jgi:hypothetical protein
MLSGVFFFCLFFLFVCLFVGCFPSFFFLSVVFADIMQELGGEVPLLFSKATVCLNICALSSIMRTLTRRI